MADYITGNFYLTEEQMKENVTYLAPLLKELGFTRESASALLGNAETESTINPGIWENLDSVDRHGFGLLQWTPYTKLWNFANERGLSPYAMETAVERLKYEIEHPSVQWGATSSYPMGFEEFVHSTLSPEYLAYVFLYNYEKPGDLDQPWRATQARKWYEFLATIWGIERGKGILVAILKRRRLDAHH